MTNRVLHLGGVVTSKQQEEVAEMVQCQESLATVARLVHAAVGARAVATHMPTEIIVEDMFVTTQTLPMQPVTSATSTVAAASAVAEVAMTSTASAGGATGAGPAAGATAVAAVVRSVSAPEKVFPALAAAAVAAPAPTASPAVQKVAVVELESHAVQASVGAPLVEYGADRASQVEAVTAATALVQAAHMAQTEAANKIKIVASEEMRAAMLSQQQQRKAHTTAKMVATAAWAAASAAMASVA